LSDRSRRPVRYANQLPPQIESLIVAAKARQAPLGCPQDPEPDRRIYHPADGDYTYSEGWVEHLVAEIENDNKWAAIKAYKI
jgi:hypothetical protein